MNARDPVISARDVHKKLSRRHVLQGVSLDLHAGQITGISGENGAGKSTLLQILAGIMRADRGQVQRRGHVGYAPQVPLLYERLTVWEHFAYHATAHLMDKSSWHARAHSLLQTYHFADAKDDPVATLSGGTKQKLNLALALLSDPALLLLDEPYGGLEWETYLRFWDQARDLRTAGKAVVVVSHLFYDRTQLDRIIELRNGKVTG